VSVTVPVPVIAADQAEFVPVIVKGASACRVRIDRVTKPGAEFVPVIKSTSAARAAEAAKKAVATAAAHTFHNMVFSF
jgi:hypothetical protein